MATVKLSGYECDRDMLPDVCVVCGAPSAVRLKKTFSWCPGWVWILILVNLIVVLVVYLILQKRMTVRVPLCEDHRGHWRKRTWLVLGSFLGVGAIALAVLLYMTNQQPPVEGAEWMCLGWVGLLFVWLVFAAVVQSSAVRPTEITSDTLRLTGVHPDFAEALREERARSREEGAYRRGRYGDERDDYDDRPDDDPRYDERPKRRRPRDERDDNREFDRRRDD